MMKIVIPSRFKPGERIARKQLFLNGKPFKAARSKHFKEERLKLKIKKLVVMR